MFYGKWELTCNNNNHTLVYLQCNKSCDLIAEVSAFTTVKSAEELFNLFQIGKKLGNVLNLPVFEFNKFLCYAYFYKVDAVHPHYELCCYLKLKKGTLQIRIKMQSSEGIDSLKDSLESLLQTLPLDSLNFENSLFVWNNTKIKINPSRGYHISCNEEGEDNAIFIGEGSYAAIHFSKDTVHLATRMTQMSESLGSNANFNVKSSGTACVKGANIEFLELQYTWDDDSIGTIILENQIELTFTAQTFIFLKGDCNCPVEQLLFNAEVVENE